MSEAQNELEKTLLDFIILKNDQNLMQIIIKIFSVDLLANLYFQNVAFFVIETLIPVHETSLE